MALKWLHNGSRNEIEMLSVQMPFYCVFYMWHIHMFHQFLSVYLEFFGVDSEKVITLVGCRSPLQVPVGFEFLLHFIGSFHKSMPQKCFTEWFLHKIGT